MKILYDDQIFARQRYGGISRYFCELIPRLAREADLDITAFEGWTINGYGLRKSADTFAWVGKKRLQPFGRNIPLSALASHGWFRLWATARRFDLYHPTYYLPARQLLRARRRVVTVHDMIHELFGPQYNGDRTREHKRAAVAWADAIITVSENTRRDLIRLLAVPAERITVIPLAASLDEVERRSPSLPPTEPFLLFVGDRRSYKNFDGLLQVLAASPRLPVRRVVCAGGGPLTSAERRRIQALGLGGQIEQRSVDDAELRWLFERACALVFPSRYEGFGIPPLEAMSLGCPVVASDRSSLPEVTGDAALRFDPDDVESLRQALATIVEDNALRARLVAAGRARANMFSWDRCAAETAALYRRLG